MRVRAVRSFVARLSDGRTFRAVAGDEFELPGGVDWLRAGLVEEVADGPESAALEPGEKAVKPAPKKKQQQKGEQR